MHRPKAGEATPLYRTAAWNAALSLMLLFALITGFLQHDVLIVTGALIALGIRGTVELLDAIAARRSR